MSRRVVSSILQRSDTKFFAQCVIFIGGVLSSFNLALAFCETPAPSTQEDMPASTIYDADPHHLWNRIHSALFVRTGPDGVVYGKDRLEPLLWEKSLYLLEGKRSDRAVAMMQEFVRVKGESLVDDPVKRAILQRDLWLVANWLIRRLDADSKKLLDPIAQAIKQLALTPEQIARLPDNYAMTIATKKFAAEFDPGKPNQSYLPPNLFQPDGPWLCVGRTDGRTAPAHLGGTSQLLRNSNKNPFTNSTFLVFLKLPAGREAGIEFIEKLARQKKPMFIVNTGEDDRITSSANRELPLLPAGSQLALVRLAMLIDSTGTIAASHLTESVQLRIMTNADFPEGDNGGLAENPHHATVQEFELQRADLFATRELTDVSDERDFSTGFSSQILYDEFEVDRKPHPPDRLYALQPFKLPSSTRRQFCYECHGVQNFWGTRSFQRPWSITEELNANSLPMYPIASTEVQVVEMTAVKWKETHPDWIVLKKLMYQW